MARSFLETALERIGQRRHSEAIRVLRRGLKSMPVGWRPIEQQNDWLHCAFWSAQEFAEFSRVSETDDSVVWVEPSYSQAWYWIAHCEWEMGNQAAAEEAITESLQLEPDHPESLCELAFFQQERETWEDALATYRLAERARRWLTADQKGLALRGQGYCLIEMWEFDFAAHALLESLYAEPGNRIALGELSFLQRRREEVERRDGLSAVERPRVYPPLTRESRDMLQFAASVPSISGIRTVGRKNYARIRKAFEAIGWLGFEGEFISLYPGRDVETQRIKSQLMRDRLFQAGCVDTGWPDGFSTESRRTGGAENQEPKVH